MELAIREEPVLDYDATATMAAEGFGMPQGQFKPDRLRWLYEDAFSYNTTVLSVFSGDRKVGQVALVHQRVQVGGAIDRAVALVDLFILPAFRSREAIGGLYGEVERFCQRQGIRFILGVPNEKGARVNIRYLKLAPFLKLDIRAGIMPPVRAPRVRSVELSALGHEAAVALFSTYLPAPGVGLHWTGESLWDRFQEGASPFGVHVVDDVLLISSRRVTRKLPHTLLCCFLPRPGVTPGRGDVWAVTAAACAMHRRPLFVYAGVNAHLPLPGISLPERLRPSPMTLQLRDFQPTGEALAFTRFELLDFDFA